MKKIFKLSILILLVFFLSMSFQKVSAGEIINDTSSSVGIELQNSNKIQDLYYTPDLITYFNYNYTGLAYDSTHSYLIEVVSNDSNIEVSLDSSTSSLSLVTAQSGHYEIELMITDENSSQVYYQTLPIYMGISADYLLVLTGGKKLLADTNTEEIVTFSYPYIMNDGTFELGERFYNELNELKINKYFSLDFKLIPTTSDFELTNLTFYSEYNQLEVNHSQVNLNEFEVAWDVNSQSEVIFDFLDIYFEYANISTSQIMKSKANLAVSRNFEEIDNIGIEFYAGIKEIINGSHLITMTEEKTKFFSYDFFLSAEDLSLNINQLLTYQYTTLFSQLDFNYNSPQNITLNVNYLANALKIPIPINGTYMLYIIAKDVKGTIIGYEQVKLETGLSLEQINSITEIVNGIGSIERAVRYLTYDQYAGYSELFEAVEFKLSSFEKTQYIYITDYDKYVLYKERYDHSLTLKNFNEQLQSLKYYDARDLLNMDAYVYPIYKEYATLPAEYITYITDVETLSKLLNYIDNREELLVFSNCAYEFEELENKTFEEGYKLYQLYKKMPDTSRQYFSQNLVEIVYSVQLILEKGIEDLTLQCGDQVNLFLSRDSDINYTISVDEKFKKSGLYCEWLLVGDDIVLYETGDLEVYLYPNKVGQCRLIAFYRMLDGTIVSDETTIVVLENEIEAIINITKETEGSYTIYDMLSFQVQLSYVISFSSEASFTWKINGTVVSNELIFEHRFSEANTYLIECHIIDPNIGIDELTAKRSIRIISVVDSDFTLTMNYQNKIYAYLNGSEIILNAYLDDYLNHDYTYEWQILNQTILNFYLQSQTGPQVIIQPLKVGTTSVIVIVDVGKYQSKRLMFTLDIEVVGEIKSLELYRNDSGLKPDSNVSYYASINGLPNVVNLAVDFKVSYSESDQFSPTEVEDNNLILNGLNKGKYKVTVTLDSKSKTDTFKIQAIALDQILFSALPIIAIIAFVLLGIKALYAKKKTKLLVLYEKNQLIRDQIQELNAKLEKQELKNDSRKIVLRNLRKWKSQLGNLFVLTKNLSIQENLELEIAEKHFSDILFIIEAGYKTFQIKYNEAIVRIYFRKLCENNFKELLDIFAQKIKTIQLQEEKSKKDEFLSQPKPEDKLKEAKRKLTPKQYVDYLRKIHYYDAEEEDDD